MFLTLKQVAKECGVSLQIVRAWERDGFLPCYRFGRKTTGGRCIIRVRQSDFRRFLLHAANPAAIVLLEENPL